MSFRDLDRNTVILGRDHQKNELTEASKARLREILTVQTALFLAAGGEIEEIEYGVSGTDYKEGIQRLDFKGKI